MEPEKNIWSQSLIIATKSYVFLISYCTLVTVIMILGEYFPSSSANTVAIIFASAVLAIPAHLSVLSHLPPSEAMRELQRQNPNYIVSFVFRTMALGAVSLIPVLILTFILFDMNWEKNTIVLATAMVLLLLAALIFAKWGTMLPAIVMQDDKTFSKAGKRGTISFFYAFPRLLLSFVLLSILQVVVTIISVIVLDAGDNFFPETGGFDFGLLLSVLVGAITGGYQVILTSVILSRAYLRAEKTENRIGLVPA